MLEGHWLLSSAYTNNWHDEGIGYRVEPNLSILDCHNYCRGSQVF